jgi:hypothetical protein
MKMKIKTASESDRYLRQMAQEAQVSVEDLVEIAVYNLISLWIDSRKNGNPLAAAAFLPDDAHDGGDVVRQPCNVVGA